MFNISLENNNKEILRNFIGAIGILFYVLTPPIRLIVDVICFGWTLKRWCIFTVLSIFIELYIFKFVDIRIIAFHKYKNECRAKQKDFC